MKPRDLRRALRKRVIKRRLGILKAQSATRPQRPGEDDPRWVTHPGIFHKYNLVCSCEMCGQHTHKKQLRRSERQQTRKRIREEMD